MRNLEAPVMLAKPVTRPPWRKRWLFRLGAVVAGLSVFGLIELACVFFRWGEQPVDVDPFVGFSSTSPLFLLNESAGRYEIAKSRRSFFAADSFPIRKGLDTRRIFCLGGSTVQGRPYSKETSFTTWLRIALNLADEQHDWEVVNCGGISYASYRLVPILQECLRYQPDVIIICTGHNEFLEERTYADVKTRAQWLSKPNALLSRFRSFTALREWLSQSDPFAAKQVASERSKLKGEVDALLDYRNGLAAYHRDDAWQRGVIEHFNFNLNQMVRLCRAAHVPVVLIAPPSNLADCPPFKSAHRDGWSVKDETRWTAQIANARSRIRNDPESAVTEFQAAIDIDDSFAMTHYEIGQCLESLGRSHEARQSFIRARDTDICPLRVLSSMCAAIGQTARDWGVPLLDAHALLEERAPGLTLGDFLLVDHVHPSFRGHQEIAMAIVGVFETQGWVAPCEGWRSAAQAEFQNHFRKLDDLYFLRGQRMLDALRAWTQGRADGPSIESRNR